MGFFISQTNDEGDWGCAARYSIIAEDGAIIAAMPRIFLTLSPSYDLVAFPLRLCEKPLRYGKGATSSMQEKIQESLDSDSSGA